MTRDLPIAYFGAVGVEDFNFPEMRRLERQLDSLQLPNRLSIFSDGHDWPPPEVGVEALEWMEVQAMLQGISNSDHSRLDIIFAKWMNQAQAYERAGESFRALSLFGSVVQAFAKWKSIDEAKSSQARLQNSGGAKDFLRLERDAENLQRTWNQQLARQVGDFDDFEKRIDAVAQATMIIRQAREYAEKKTGGSRRIAARRFLLETYIGLREQIPDLQRGKEFSRVIDRYQLMTTARPENPQVWILLASAQVVAGDRKGALESLRSAIRKGLIQPANLEEDSRFEPLHAMPEFRRMLMDNASQK